MSHPRKLNQQKSGRCIASRFEPVSGPEVQLSLEQAVEEHRTGHLEAASRLYEDILRNDPTNADAHHLLGVAAHQSGQQESAIHSISKAIALDDSVSDYRLNLGSALQALGRLDDAIDEFQHALRLNSASFVAHNNLANAMKQRGDLRASLVHYENAVRLAPTYALAHCNMGAVQIEIGELEAAETSLRQALQLDPELVEAYRNLAIARARRGDSEDAISNYVEVVCRQPGLAEAWINLGGLLQDCCQTEQARSAYNRVAEIRQDPIWELRAASLCPSIPESNQQIDDFRESFAQAVQCLSERGMSVSTDRLAASECEPPSELAYQGRNDVDLRTSYAEMFVNQIPRLEPARRTGRVHVGFVVAAHRELIFLRFMGGIVRHLGGSDLDITIFCVEQGKPYLTKGLRSETIRFAPLPGQLDQAAKTIATEAVDVLFFFEVGTDSFGYFLPFFGSAAVQCTSWGLPFTTGIPTMDFFLSSDLLEPSGADSHYSEQLVRLATLPVCYQRPSLPGVRKSRADMGLPKGRSLYVCPQSLSKFHPDFDPVLASILRRDEDGLLILLESENRYSTNSLADRLSVNMPEVAERVVFLPRQSREDFINLLLCCDVVLDPFHFGGGATTYDALAFGVPIVTMPGAFMRGRVTAACYTKVGMTSCVAQSPDDYVSLAVRLGTDVDYRETISAQILEVQDRLYGDQTAADEMKAFFLETGHASR